MKLGLANVYAQCWSRSGKESNAMWELYSKGFGVRIGMAEADIRLFIKFRGCCYAPEWELRSFPIEYSGDNVASLEAYNIIGADAYLESLRHKRSAFDYEDEYRFVLLNRAGLDSIGKILKDRQLDVNSYRSLCNKEIIKYPIDLSKIKEIVIDYRAPEYHRETIKRLCSDKRLQGKFVDSQLL